MLTDVELIKSKIDIVDFISSYANLKKAGRNFKGLCPFHSEKTPSFVVSPERQTWHCFGACNMGGDVISFYEKWEGVDFLEALKTLAEKAGVILQKFTPTQDSALKEKLYAVNNFAAEFYHYLLVSHKIGERARKYLDERKISREIIKTFQLGYAPESWDSLNKFLSKKGYSDDLLSAAGLLIKSERGKFYDRFRGRLIFTLNDHRGKIIGFAGRLIPPSSDREAKYINSPETTLYIKGNVLYGMDKTKEEIKAKGFAIIVEGEFDFLASYSSGITNVVAIKGSALTENQTLLLKRYTDTFYLALDSDFAGSEAAKRGIEIAEASGINVKIIKLLKGKDPADCVAQGMHFWKKSVETSMPVYDFIIDSALLKFDKNDALGKKKIAESVIPFLSKIQNPIIASHYIKLLTKALSVTEESVETSIELFNKKKKLSPVPIPPENQKKLRSELLEEHFLSLLLQSADLNQSLKNAFEIVTPDDFVQSPVKTILALLSEEVKKNDKFDIKKFNRAITPEIAPVFDRAYLIDLGPLAKDEKLKEKELTKTAREIKKITLRRTIAEKSTLVGKLEDIKDLIQKLKELEA